MIIVSIDPLIQQFVRELRCLVNKSPKSLRPSVLNLVHDRARKRSMHDVRDKVPVQSRITTRPTLVDHSHNPEDAGEDLVAKDFFNILNQHDHKWTENFLSMSPSLIDSVLASELNQWGLKENMNASETVGVVAATSAAPSTALGIMGVVGFTGNGIAAGSLAALWQSTIGNVAAGSLFAGLQSMGAVGALTTSFTFGFGAIPLAGYGIYKFATWKSPENRLQVHLNDPEWVERIWQSKGL